MNKENSNISSNNKYANSSNINKKPFLDSKYLTPTYNNFNNDNKFLVNRKSSVNMDNDRNYKDINSLHIEDNFSPYNFKDDPLVDIELQRDILNNCSINDNYNNISRKETQISPYQDQLLSKYNDYKEFSILPFKDNYKIWETKIGFDNEGLSCYM